MESLPTFEARGNGRDGVKFPSPEVTIIDPANRPKGEVSFMSNRVEQAEETKTEVVERAVTVADIENIDKLNLDDFSCDFSKVEIPKGDITDDAMDDIVNQFFSGLEAA